MQEADESCGKTAAAPEQAKLAPDEQTVGLVLPLYGYHQGPHPRAGRHVGLRRSLRTAVVLGTLSDHTVLVADEEDGRVYRTSSASLVTARQAVRLTLSEHLEVARQLALKGNRYGISILAAHFRGINGTAYASPAAFAWCVRAMCEGHMFRSATAEVEAWIQAQIEASSDLGDALPPPAESGEIELWSGKPAEAQAATDATSRSLESALQLGADSIAKADGDFELQRTYADSHGSRLAIDVQSGLQVVVLGPSNVESAEGFVDVLFLDNLEACARHASGLSFGDDTIDPGWLWEVVTDSARHGKSPLPIALWLASSDIGPSGQSDASLERSLTRIFGAAFAARQWANDRPALAQKWIRLARECWRSLPKVEQSRVAAAIPELVSSLSKRRAPSPAAPLRAAFRATIDGLLTRHPVPLIARDRPPPPSAAVEIEGIEAVDLVIEANAAAPVMAVPRASNAQSRRRVGAVKFGNSQRVLRFDLSDHALLASEWALVDKESAHLDAVTSALSWLEARMGLSLPKTWREGAHEIERQGVTLQLESGEGIFAFRLDHPDTTHPTRWWRMEATVLAGMGGVGGMVGVRLSARDLVSLPAPSRTVPAIVREWARSPGLGIAGAPAGAPTFVRDEEGMSRLLAAVQDSGRDAPLWVVAARFELIKPLQALARMYVVEPAMWAQYATHYGALAPSTVHVFQKAGGTRAHVDISKGQGLEQLRELTLQARHRPEVPAFRDIRNAIAEARLRALSNGKDSALNDAVLPPPVPTAEDIRALISREVRDYEELLQVAEDERNAAVADRDSALHDLQTTTDEIVELKRRLHSAQLRLGSAAPTDEPTTERAAPPATLEGLAEWAISLRPRVVFPEKTLRSASRVAHSETALIYACLEQLSESYWRSRWADDEASRRQARDEWEEFLKENRLRLSGVGVIAARHLGEYRGIVGGSTYTMDMHVAGSNAHDPLRCLRIYCYVDELNRRVVVGHLPTHLTNALT